MTIDDLVIGAGPVGLLAASRLSREGRRVTILAPRLPSPGDPARVEAVPAGFLALLLEFGIHPRQIGADQVHRSRSAAWEARAPAAFAALPSVHLERPALDLALLGLATASEGVRVVVGRASSSDQRLVEGKIGRVIDASGRAAVTASSRHRPDRPWAGRTFLAPRVTSRPDGEFAIAALPDGFAYRLGGATLLCLGVVGRGKAIAGAPSRIESRLRRFAPWLLDDLPPLNLMSPGAAGAASVQWTEGSSPIRIGDAALARDALSSHGLATGAAEALCLAAIRGAMDRDLLALRAAEQRDRHLSALLETISRNRFAASPVWRAYRTFVMAHIRRVPHEVTAALRAERLVAISPVR